MNVQHVPLEWVPAVWPKVQTHIASALEHSKGDYTVEHVQAYLTSGRWTLLVAADGETIHGAAAVEFFNRPNDRVAFITAIGGKLVSNEDTFAQLKALMLAMGATTIEGAAREAIARLWSRYGFEEKYRIVGVKL
jgi:hypothetical protein